MTPWYERAAPARRPAGGDGGRSRGGLAGLGPLAAGRFARRSGPSPRRPAPRLAPPVRPLARPVLGRGSDPSPPSAGNDRPSHADWARGDPAGLVAAALVHRRAGAGNDRARPDALGPPSAVRRLRTPSRIPRQSALLEAAPEALVEAVRNPDRPARRRPRVLSRNAYTDTDDDRRLPRSRLALFVGCVLQDGPCRS